MVYSGVIPYADVEAPKGRTRIYLLGKEYAPDDIGHDVWSDFGGQAYYPDDLVQSAADQLYKKSMGAFGTVDDIAERIKKLGTRAELPGSGGGATFLLPIRYFLPDIWNGIFSYFKRCTANLSFNSACKFQISSGWSEKHQIGWFSAPGIATDPSILPSFRTSFGRLLQQLPAAAAAQMRAAADAQMLAIGESKASPSPIASQKGAIASASASTSEEEELELPTPSLEAVDRKCSPVLDKLIVGQELAQGSVKTVYAICDDAGCKTSSDVLQVVSIVHPKVLAELRKEVAIMRAIQEQTVANRWPPLLLPIKSYVECPGDTSLPMVARNPKAFIVQARATETMKTLGKRQFAAFANTPELREAIFPVLYTIPQLVEAFSLAHLLYQRYSGVVHSDLKPDNVLVRDNRFYIADFGFSGALRGRYVQYGAPRQGFTRNFGCSRNVPVAPRLRAYFNVWQLELLLRASYVTFLELPSAIPGVRIVRRFESVDQLGVPSLVIPPETRVDLDSSCDSLVADIRTTEDSYTGIKRATNRRLFPSRVTDAQVEHEITSEQATLMAMTAINSSPDYEKKLPIWTRYLVRQGLLTTLDRSPLIYVPNMYPRAAGTLPPGTPPPYQAPVNPCVAPSQTLN